MKKLYELMSKNKLNSLEEIYNFCINSKYEKLLEVVTEAFAITNIHTVPSKSNSLFNFSASLTLSGGSYPCESIGCRLKKVEDLAKFATLYSDQTTIYNPFDFVYFLLNSAINNTIFTQTLINESINAFSITFKFRPLLETGIINYSKTLYLSCSKCKKDQDKLSKSINKRLESIATEIIFPDIQNIIEIEYLKKSFHLVGSELLIGEDMYMHYKDFPQYMKQKGIRINNMKSVDFGHPVIKMIIDEAIDSLMFQKLNNLNGITQTYLTTNTIEKDLLTNIGKQSEVRALELFANNLPVHHLSFNQAIKLRNRYPDEFGSFQNHIYELMSKAKSFESQAEFNNYVTNSLNKDLNDLNRIQIEGKKKLRQRGFAEGIFFVASIAISSITNIQVPEIAGIARSIYECKKLLTEADEIEQSIQRSPLFFYYKLTSS